MNFGDALDFVKAGKKVYRLGWNGKGMYIALVNGGDVMIRGKSLDYHSYIEMKTAQGYSIPWVASQTDLLSDDWEKVT